MSSKWRTVIDFTVAAKLKVLAAWTWPLFKLIWDYARWAVWSHFMCFYKLKQASIYFSCLEEYCNSVLLRNIRTVYKTSPDCPSVWGWVDNVWVFSFEIWQSQYFLLLTLKDNTLSCRITLPICGGPCHPSSFKQHYGDLIFLWEQLVYSVMETNIYIDLCLYD